jgi:L-lactate utilization protein LutB
MNFEKEYQDLKRRLDEAIKLNLEEIKECQEEIDLIMNLVDEHGHSEFFQTVAKDALDYARDIVADGEKLIKASNLLK